MLRSLWPEALVDPKLNQSKTSELECGEVVVAREGGVGRLDFGPDDADAVEGDGPLLGEGDAADEVEEEVVAAGEDRVVGGGALPHEDGADLGEGARVHAVAGIG